ncbi:thiol-disulfide oxidoreductase DCC family protein [Alteribacillus sp. JSM 102045]|uniref:thiol-disulfide oxidoreductase DCC family protein n=1 Tax=Alteribacillus sp. JSM 102045 TaxID=1562101 RepID=UPI0035C13F8C
MTISNKVFVVFYDGACTLCQKTKQEIEKWDKHQVLTWRSIEDPSILEEYPFLKEDRIQQEMHLLEEGTYLYTGFAAVKRILQLFPAGKIFTPLLYFPGADWAGEQVYKQIAKNRHLLLGEKCPSGACEIKSDSFDRNS